MSNLIPKMQGSNQAGGVCASWNSGTESITTTFNNCCICKCSRRGGQGHPTVRERSAGHRLLWLVLFFSFLFQFFETQFLRVALATLSAQPLSALQCHSLLFTEHLSTLTAQQSSEASSTLFLLCPATWSCTASFSFQSNRSRFESQSPPPKSCHKPP